MALNPLITSITKKADIQSPVEEQEEIPIDDEYDPFSFIRNLPSIEQTKVVLPRKTRSSPKITLVLDLDETLVHCSTVEMTEKELEFQVDFGGETYKVCGNFRPHCKEFLNHFAKRFEIVLFTASQKPYANIVCNHLDPDRRIFKFRLFRQDCLFVKGNYIKDLSCLGRDLKRVIIVDNSILAFGYHLSNGIPIRSWYDDKDDNELLHLVPFLESLQDVEDVRPYIEKAFGLREMIHSE